MQNRFCCELGGEIGVGDIGAGRAKYPSLVAPPLGAVVLHREMEFIFLAYPSVLRLNLTVHVHTQASIFACEYQNRIFRMRVF